MLALRRTRYSYALGLFAHTKHAAGFDLRTLALCSPTLPAVWRRDLRRRPLLAEKSANNLSVSRTIQG